MNTLRLESWKRKFQAYDLLYYHSDYGVTESPRANLFTVIKGTVVTPSDHILKGITRSVILNLAKDHYAVEERPLSLDELRAADEAFLCSTSKRIIPVTQLDEHVIGSGKLGIVTLQLMELFDNYTGFKED
jgi:branched-subunit amino acid aminotransferase/4-amino-4-deoxychorismate lyase